MKDADYDKLEVAPCDVKAIQNTPKGVSDFWVKALLNHPLGGMITEKDRPILGYLLDISLELHEEKGEGYDLIFTFAENNYFEGTVIRKELHMKNKGILDKTVSTELKWKDNASNPTLKKQKKKRKGKKVTVEVKADSFFNIFDEIDSSKQETKKPSDEDEEDDAEEEMQMKLQTDLDNADQIRDDLVPLALEYYLGVIEKEDQDDSDDEGSDDSDGAKPNKKKGKKA